MMEKNTKGITLVALVVTIIVLIILAGVSINLVIGNNGIITKAKEARENFAIAANEEDYNIKSLLNEMDDKINKQTAQTNLIEYRIRSFGSTGDTTIYLNDISAVIRCEDNDGHVVDFNGKCVTNVRGYYEQVYKYTAPRGWTFEQIQNSQYAQSVEKVSESVSIDYTSDFEPDWGTEETWTPVSNNPGSFNGFWDICNYEILNSDQVIEDEFLSFMSVVLSSNTLQISDVTTYDESPAWCEVSCTDVGCIGENAWTLYDYYDEGCGEWAQLQGIAPVENHEYCAWGFGEGYSWQEFWASYFGEGC